MINTQDSACQSHSTAASHIIYHHIYHSTSGGCHSHSRSASPGYIALLQLNLKNHRDWHVYVREWPCESTNCLLRVFELEMKFFEMRVLHTTTWHAQSINCNHRGHACMHRYSACSSSALDVEDNGVRAVLCCVGEWHEREVGLGTGDCDKDLSICVNQTIEQMSNYKLTFVVLLTDLGSVPSLFVG